MMWAPRGMRAALCLGAAAIAGPGAVAAVAHAKPAKVTGEQTTVALSAAATKALTDAGVAINPLGKATSSDAGITFPVAGGRVNLAKHRGIVRHVGGIALTSSKRTVRLRGPVAVVTRRGAFIAMRIAGLRHRHRHHGFRPVRGRYVRVFKLSDLKTAQSGGTTTLTASLSLTRRAARLLDRGFGTSFTGGEAAGTATTTLTTTP